MGAREVFPVSLRIGEEGRLAKPDPDVVRNCDEQQRQDERDTPAQTLNASSPTMPRTIRITASERKRPSVAVVWIKLV